VRDELARNEKPDFDENPAPATARGFSFSGLAVFPYNHQPDSKLERLLLPADSDPPDAPG
jgi:hypothetical protein